MIFQKMDINKYGIGLTGAILLYIIMNKEPSNAKERSNFRLGVQWQIFRAFMLAKEHNTCQLCGKQYKEVSHLNIHHRYITHYTNLDPDRFIVVCKTCHEYIHHKYNAPAYKQAHWFGLSD